MQFDSFSAFIAMGSHGPYVWTCYGVTLVIIGLCVLAPRRRLRVLLARERRLQRRQQPG